MLAPLRFIMTVIGLVLIAVAVALILLFSPLREMLRQRLESAISRHYGTEARIEALRIVPLEQGVELVGITVYNPEPFPREPAIECARILLRTDLATLFSATPTFASVEIEEPKAHLRYDLGKGSNLGALLRSADEAEALAAETTKRTRFIVQDCVARNAKVTLTSNAILGAPIPINVAPFRLDEVGGHAPVSGWEVSRIFVKTLLLESLGVKGLLGPAADLIRDELGRTARSGSGGEEGAIHETR